MCELLYLRGGGQVHVVCTFLKKADTGLLEAQNSSKPGRWIFGHLRVVFSGFGHFLALRNENSIFSICYPLLTGVFRDFWRVFFSSFFLPSVVHSQHVCVV